MIESGDVRLTSVKSRAVCVTGSVSAWLISDSGVIAGILLAALKVVTCYFVKTYV
jgi:hypothetical protein